MNKRKISLLTAFLVLAIITLKSQTTNSITQYSVTFTFDAQYQYGTFANGDYWVVGPVTINSITPDYINGYNGWEVNPSIITKQGFDKRAHEFDASLIPSLPYAAQPGQSVVKAISRDTTITSSHVYLKTAVVLTVVSAIPPDSGKTVFRPPYFSTDKKLYSTNNIDTTLLPSLDSVAQMPPLPYLYDKFYRLQLDHQFEWVCRYIHPEDNMPDYGGAIAIRNAEAALRLMMNDPISQKWPLLISYIQTGIDIYHIAANGGSWKPNGGHAEGRKLPATFAAWLLNDQDMKDTIKNAGIIKFGENGGMYYSAKSNRVLYGQQGLTNSTEFTYWQSMVDRTGSRTHPDPYGYIDGGREPWHESYQQVTSMPWKSEALSIFMICEMKEIWNNSNFLDYIDRWVGTGAWTQPDPCAPADTTMNNYGITFGPNGNGGCILDTDSSDGIGRFPALHGIGKDSGNYVATHYSYKYFTKNMWNAYRQYGNPIKLSASNDDTICPGEITILNLYGIDTTKCVISWNGGSYGTDTSHTAAPSSTSNITASVKYKNGLGCASTHNFKVTVENCTGIYGTPIGKSLKVFPNPTNNNLNISFSSLSSTDISIKLSDMQGRIIYSESQNKFAGQYQSNIDLSKNAKGVYLLQIITDGETVNRKVVVK